MLSPERVEVSSEPLIVYSSARYFPDHPVFAASTRSFAGLADSDSLGGVERGGFGRLAAVESVVELHPGSSGGQLHGYGAVVIAAGVSDLDLRRQLVFYGDSFALGAVFLRVEFKRCVLCDFQRLCIQFVASPGAVVNLRAAVRCESHSQRSGAGIGPGLSGSLRR